jgi:hypothetical protein
VVNATIVSPTSHRRSARKCPASRWAARFVDIKAIVFECGHQQIVLCDAGACLVMMMGLRLDARISH